MRMAPVPGPSRLLSASIVAPVDAQIEDALDLWLGALLNGPPTHSGAMPM